jgi:hypothetical protein
MVIKDPKIEPFEIHVDNANHTLIENSIVEKGKNAGKTTQTTVGYYSSVKSCLIKIIELKAKADCDKVDIVDLKSYVQVLMYWKDEISNAIEI